jgi:hypothetical protein
MTISTKETTTTDFNEFADRYVATWNEPPRTTGGSGEVMSSAPARTLKVTTTA